MWGSCSMNFKGEILLFVQPLAGSFPDLSKVNLLLIGCYKVTNPWAIAPVCPPLTIPSFRGRQSHIGLVLFFLVDNFVIFLFRMQTFGHLYCFTVFVRNNSSVEALKQ